MHRRTLLALATSAALIAVASPALAALKVGERAPAFTAQAAMAGKPFTFRLADALRKGPVVLYFFPKAFTGGCDAQAQMFSAAIDDYRAAGATVIGVSRDPIARLQEFSVQKCSGKFPVASDENGNITRAYKAVLAIKPDYSDRTSYVIGRDGRIAYEYTNLTPDKHVENTLRAVRALKAKG